MGLFGAEKRKFAAGLTVVALLLGLFFSPAAAFTPGDIEGHWAQERIQGWLDRGLASGYPDGTFRPDEEVTRAEFVAFANRSFEIPETEQDPGFDDVHEGDWHYGHVAAAVQAEILTGYPDHTFRPNHPITREEAAAIVDRLLDLEEVGPADPFADEGDISDWAEAAVAAVAAAEIMTGYPDDTFRPGHPITRAETVSTLDRALEFELPALPAVEFTVEPEALAMEVGDQAYIQVYVTEPPEDPWIDYETTDERVASVDEEGLVTAGAEGEAEIIVTADAEGYEPSSKAVAVAVEEEIEQKAASFTALPAGTFQGKPLKVDFEEFVDEDGEYMEDGAYDIHVELAYTKIEEDSFTVEDVAFADGQAEGVVILDGNDTLVEAHHLLITFTIEGVEYEEEYVIDQEISGDSHIVEGSGAYREAEEEIAFEVEALDLVGDRITHQFVEVDRLYIGNEDVSGQASAEWADDAWKVTVAGQEEPADADEFLLRLEYTWSETVVELDPVSWETLVGPRTFFAAGIDAPREVEEGETFEVTFTVENTGEKAGTQDVTAVIYVDEELNGKEEVERWTETVTLGAGEKRSEAVDVTAKIGLPHPEYLIELSTDDDLATAVVKVVPQE